MRRNRLKRKDDNHDEVVRDLQRLGCSVIDLSQVGGGCPDLLIGWRGRNFLVEIKNPNRPPSATRLSASQEVFRHLWRGDPPYLADNVLGLLEQLGEPRDE